MAETSEYSSAFAFITSQLSSGLPSFTKMISKFKTVIGFSDHSLGNLASIIAVSLGARVIEKHFSDTKGKKGNDHFHSLNGKDLKKYLASINIIQKIIKTKKGRPVLQCEKISRKNARRSLVTKKNLKIGSILKYNNIICKRPGTGISPIDLKKIVGKKIKRNLPEDYIINYSDLI